MIASLVDGSLALVDPETGRTHWVFDSGSPLLSSSGFAEDSKGGQYTIFPGSDGSLYSYRQGGQGQQGLQVLQLSHLCCSLFLGIRTLRALTCGSDRARIFLALRFALLGSAKLECTQQQRL